MQLMISIQQPPHSDLFGNRNFFARASKIVGGLKGADNGKRSSTRMSTMLNNAMICWHDFELNGDPLLAVYTQHQPLLVQVRWCLGSVFVSANLTGTAVSWWTIRDDTGKYFQGEGKGQRLSLYQKHRKFRYSTSRSSCVHHRRDNIRGGAFHCSDERIWARRSRNSRRDDDSQLANVFARSHESHGGH